MSFEPSPEGVRVSCVSGDLHLPAAYLLYSGEARIILLGMTCVGSAGDWLDELSRCEKTPYRRNDIIPFRLDGEGIAYQIPLPLL